MLRTFMLFFSLAAIAGGCASYTPSSAVLESPKKFAAQRAENGVAVSVSPLTDPEEQKKLFDADFTEKGVLCLQVVAENQSAPLAVVRPSDMSLELPGGTQLSPVSANTVVAKVGEKGSVAGATIAFGLIGYLASANAEDNARAARLEDYRSKTFSEARLASGNSAHGVVFFIPPPGTKAFDSATFSVRFVDAEDATSRTIELPLTNLDFKEVPLQAPEKKKKACC